MQTEKHKNKQKGKTQIKKQTTQIKKEIANKTKT